MPSSSSMSTTQHGSSGYIHSYTRDEQDRLIRQAQFLEPYVHDSIDFAGCRHILEVGCGVGAQTKLLLQRWPYLKITSTDISEIQIARAREFLAPELAAGRVALHIYDGNRLPFDDGSFDGAFVCFVLEHAANPAALLSELNRVMIKAGVIYCTEVFNTGLYIHPSCPAIHHYWEIFNRCQRELGGDPDIGIKLCNLAVQIGRASCRERIIAPQLDSRMTDRRQREEFIHYWAELFLSAASMLLH